MSQVIKLKRSAVAGKAPSTNDIELGEVAINTTDGRVYIKKEQGGVASIVDITAQADVPDDGFSYVRKGDSWERLTWAIE